MFSPDQWAASTGVAFYNGVATQSLRFDDGSSAYLNRTPSSAGNRKTWTWSGWVKRSNLGATHTLFDSRPTGEFAFGFLSGDTFYVASSSNFRITNQVFRDVSSWYHFVVVLDTTQATGSNRIKVYVNGNQITSFGTSADPSQNAEFGVNFTQLHSLGRYTSGGYFDGYMAEVNLIDGQALDPTYFGEFKNGVWIAKRYTGSYGTNGFRLQFNQTGTGTASSSTIGADTSGNANHFSSSGIVASDCDMPDSPENNWCTTNGIMRANITRSEGNLKMVGVGGNYDNLGTNFSVDVEDTEGWYWEYRSGGNDASTVIGIAEPQNALFNQSDPAGSFTNESDGYGYMGDGNKRNNNSSTSYGNSWTSGDIIGIAIKSGSIYFYKNGTIQNSGTSAFSSITGLVTPTFGINGTHSGIANFGQDSSFAGNETAQGNTDANGIGDFYYTVPTGYKALCSANLPEPTISPNANTQADDYFNTVLYTGTGTTDQSVTGVGFQSDFTWIKSRSDAFAHWLNDAVRGAGKGLRSDATDAEFTTLPIFLSFDADGFTVDVDDATANNTTNGSGSTFVAWNWKAGGTAVSNTDGTITSSVSANTDAGFSIVTYTGSTGVQTVGHGLSKAPRMIIIKNRDSAENWRVYNQSAGGGTGSLKLSGTDAFFTSSAYFNNTDTTSSVFTVNSASPEVNENGSNHVAYCFAEIEGYSKIGSYTGNGSADGTFVYTGFRPAWVMMKQTNATGNWYIWDDTRENINPVNIYIRANLSNAEGGTETGQAYFDFVSNGFKLRASSSDFGEGNTSGNTYIYMAFAENPFKYSTAK